MVLAGIVILGWALAYTALMRGIDAAQPSARTETGPTKVSANLPTPKAP